jgi:hypothetical protein
MKEDVKSFTVQYLRELAKKHLGKGYSKLTKDELLAALKKAVPELLQTSAKKAAPAKAAAKQAASKVAKAAGEAKAKVKAKVAEVAEVAEVMAGEAKVPVREEAEVQHPAEPLVEGFFVARVAGEGEARRHHLTEEQAPAAVEHHPNGGYDERLGELPMTYQDDAALILPRDPQTLFFFWDFRRETREEAAAGLTDPRAVIRVYDGQTLVKEQDFAFESRSFYVHGLPPARSYRVEACFVGRDGRVKRVGRATNTIALPNLGPSSDTTVRFLRIPWGLPLSQLKQLLKDGRASIQHLGIGQDYLTVNRGAFGSSAQQPTSSTPGANDFGQRWVTSFTHHPF